MSKDKLIKHLKNDVYCRIGVSEVSGVGVIAIKDIPKGIDPFKSLFPYHEKSIKLTGDDVKGLDKPVQKIIRDFFGSGKDSSADVLYYGPNYMNVSFYMNHSDKPNVDIKSVKGYEYLRFVTNKKIKKGEELTINYKDYDKF